MLRAKQPSGTPLALGRKSTQSEAILCILCSKMMEADAFISGAIEKAVRGGISTLSPLERKIFLISEAEVSCDMGSGIDYLFKHYGRSGMLECAQAFESIRAVRISRALLEIRYVDEQIDEDSTELAQSLISNRSDYDYSSIREWVGALLRDHT